MTSCEDREQRRKELLDRYGPIVGNKDLQKALGFSSMGALRQALSRRRLPFPVFPLEGRRGKFAFTSDLIDWLEAARMKASRTLRGNE